MNTESPHGPMISSGDVEGTDVYSTASREKIGDIRRLMIDKRSGRIGYAVMSFGGFLGIGEKEYPVPWQALKYDGDLEGYVTGITESQLENAPGESDQAWKDRDWETQLHDNYAAPYYWEPMPRI
mgnify:CR=1 FL=1